ncbi:DNA-binding protein SMUBP-2-like [Tubulanus polymorphus]|uniref:DNA-binding protein SMUBP-2-like n=1 Tax=Tubulanus polymorphus TaxID=672921 RepID=UPI003DA5B5B8
MPGVSLDEYVSKTSKLIELERETEKKENSALLENVSPKELQKKGICLLNMRFSSQSSGLFGRMLYTFEPFYMSKEMPSHSLSPGDIVAVNESNEATSAIVSGVISHVHKNSINVAIDDATDVDLDDNQRYRLLKLANDVTYKRLKRALENLRTFRSGPAGNLIDILFAESDLRPSLQTPPDLVFYNQGLDESQKEAVRFALSRPDVAVIHGPPGTGKTTTIVEVIRQAVKLGMKVLTAAPSNIAVDNLVERLVNGNVKAVRLGHPARALKSIQKYSLDAILSHSDETKLVADVRKDINSALSRMRKVRDRGERQGLRGDLKYLRKELRQREDAATRDILKRAEVVLSTLTSASDDGPLKLLDAGHFDLVVIDECSQAIEASCWIPLLKSPRCVLAGDHQQLPPTIISNQAAKEGLAITLMERTLELYENRVMRMLTTQYRMNNLIMQWSSDELYNSRLVADASVKDHLLRDLNGVEDTEDTSIPLLMIDTAGCDLYELDVMENVSKGNEGEVDLVTIHVDSLIGAGVKAEDIAVIAPYNLQVELLRLKMSEKYPKLEIKSVDSFQGREKEAVVISLVRSNDKGEVGFLAEDRRINVAITRARRHLAVICDSETVSHHAFLKSLTTYLSDKGEVRSAFQYQQEHEVGYGCQRPANLSSKMKKSPLNQTKKSSKGQNQQKSTEKRERQEIQKKLQEFLTNNQQIEYSFPPSLTANERRIVHELCEDLGLLHVSHGENESRFISVKKVTIDEQNDHKLEDGVDMSDSESSIISIGELSDKVDSDVNSVPVPPTELVSKSEKLKSQQPSAESSEQASAKKCELPSAEKSDRPSAESDDGELHIDFKASAIEDDSVNKQKLKSQQPSAESSEQASAKKSELPSAEKSDRPSAESDDGELHIDFKASAIEDNSVNKQKLTKASQNVISGVSELLDKVKSSDKTVENGIKMQICPFCNKDVPMANFSLHTLRCRLVTLNTADNVASDSQSKSSASKKANKRDKKNNKKKSSSESATVANKNSNTAKIKPKSSIEDVDKDDFDALIAAATKMDTICNFPKCKEYVTCLGQHCSFCNRTFCLTHHIPEVHGCGATAKEQARKTIVREGVLYRGSGVPSKKPDPTTRAHLLRKLEKNLTEKTDKRKVKKKS